MLQGAFKKKHGLKVPLLSDETRKTIEAYGAWGERSMYGRKFAGIVRTTVLIGPDGKVARVWPKVKVDGHAEEDAGGGQKVFQRVIPGQNL